MGACEVAHVEPRLLPRKRGVGGGVRFDISFEGKAPFGGLAISIHRYPFCRACSSWNVQLCPKRGRPCAWTRMNGAW
ncbi:Hypothetical protein A7982_07522 [Minicystis rosea]|nr:Hypothetical protein A7982_07522 [Minicystis rosea]